MKLYVYDHCPFCVRAKMILGLRKVDFEEIVVSYDDEKTPTDLVGRKMLPILIKEDGTAMPESLDIVKYIDEKYADTPLNETIRPVISEWLEKVRQHFTKLTSPREIEIGLPEFANRSAVEYFINKKTPSYGDFEENKLKTETYLQQIHQDLQDFVPLMHSTEHLNETLSYEDIVTFPILRNLTMVKGIIFPAEVRAYLDKMAEKTGVKLYDDIAI